MATTENLKDAFAGESQANRKYLAFAEKAEKDGFPQVAKLFRAAAAAETVHAHAHLRAMGGINDTTDNLKAAIAGEGFEYQEMYPEYVAEAEAEGNKRALYSFKNALAVEEIHHGLYTAALEAVKAGGVDYRLFHETPVWLVFREDIDGAACGTVQSLAPYYFLSRLEYRIYAGFVKESPSRLEAVRVDIWSVMRVKCSGLNAQTIMEVTLI